MASKKQTSVVDMRYDLTDVTSEPSDEQLSQLMKEVAEEAREKAAEAQSKFFQNMQEYIRLQKEKYVLPNIKLNNA